MTIGPLVPGSPTTVTPDLGHAGYASAQGPGPDFQYEADDILSVLQVALNVQAKSDTRTGSGSWAQMIALADVAAGWKFTAFGYGSFTASATNPGYGTYWSVASTGTPGITWVSDQWAQVAAPSTGICRVGPITGYDSTTPTGRIPMSVVQNHLRSCDIITTAGAIEQTLTSSSSAEITNSSWQLTGLLEGDIVRGLLGPFYATSAATTGNSTVRLRVTFDYGGATPSNFDIRTLSVPNNASFPFFISFKQEIPSSTNGAIRCFLYATASSTSYVTITGLDNTDYIIGHVDLIRP